MFEKSASICFFDCFFLQIWCFIRSASLCTRDRYKQIRRYLSAMPRVTQKENRRNFQLMIFIEENQFSELQFNLVHMLTVSTLPKFRRILEYVYQFACKPKVP